MVVRPAIGEVGGSSTRVPAPALIMDIRALPVPLPPLIEVSIVSRAEPTVQMLSGERSLVWLSTPPEMLVVPPSRTRMPPETRVRRTPSPRRRLEEPAKVREFGVTEAPTPRVPPPTSWMLLLAETVAEYSLGWSGRTMRSGEPALPPPPVLLTVAKSVPSPLTVMSAKAQGKMPLLAEPLGPVVPLSVEPPAKMTLELPGSLETPKFSPRKSTEAPRVSTPPTLTFWAGAMLSGAPKKTKVISPARFFSRVIVEAPRANVGLPRFSVRLSLTLVLPRTTSSPPRKPISLAFVLLVPRRPLAVTCPAPLTVMLRSSSQRVDDLSM